MNRSGALAWSIVGTATACVLTPHEVWAYVGPGAGLTAIGSALALLGGILLAIIGFVWYPVKRLLRARLKKPDSDIVADGNVTADKAPLAEKEKAQSE